MSGGVAALAIMSSNIEGGIVNSGTIIGDVFIDDSNTGNVLRLSGGRISGRIMAPNIEVIDDFTAEEIFERDH